MSGVCRVARPQQRARRASVVNLDVGTVHVQLHENLRGFGAGGEAHPPPHLRGISLARLITSEVTRHHRILVIRSASSVKPAGSVPAQQVTEHAPFGPSGGTRANSLAT